MRKLPFVLLCAWSAQARVVQLTIEQRQSPAFEGKRFGTAGQYELLRGHFTGEVDPKAPQNRIINDIQLAPKNARGMVEYTATFAIARPLDPAKASGMLLYTVPNRGRGAAAGNPDGHISVVSGWQGDVTPGDEVQSITVPIAKNHDGSPVTGPVTALFIDAPKGANTLRLSSAVSAIVYQLPATLDTSKATLSRRATEDGPRTVIPATAWAFADCSKTPFPGKPDPTRICTKEGFDSTQLYELTYTAKDPLVLGLGYAATRDLNSFLRYDTSAANPLAGQIKYAIAEGNSQSGNYLRSAIHLGFNQDEKDRIVWDGMNPHIAGRQLAMNYRFAVAGGTSKMYEPGSDAVVWWSHHPDTGRNRPAAGMLDRCTASRTCPKIIETFGGVEFWFLRMSPDLVGTDAKADIPLPPNVRRYYFPSTTHGGGAGGFNITPAKAPAGCVLPANPNPERETLNALRQALVEWVTKGTEPPPSRYPKLHPASPAEGQLVPATQAALGFPNIPGAPSPDGVINSLLDYDWGPDFNYIDLSGVITKTPPAIRRVLPTLVPKTDVDGNDLGGVPSVLREVPLGTYLGWNITAAGFNKGKVCGLQGGYIPFARTTAERFANKDPRPSVEERYGTHEHYVDLVKAAAARAVKARFLLPEDAEKLIEKAEASDVLLKK